MTVQSLPNTGSRYVLIVDDDPAILDVYEMTISDLGLLPVVTSDASVALEKAVAFRPVLILLDQRMPDVTGVELARQLRELVSPVTPIVLVSARHDLAVEAATVGASFLKKPFDVNELIEVVLDRTERAEALTA